MNSANVLVRVLIFQLACLSIALFMGCSKPPELERDMAVRYAEQLDPDQMDQVLLKIQKADELKQAQDYKFALSRSYGEVRDIYRNLYVRSEHRRS